MKVVYAVSYWLIFAVFGFMLKTEWTYHLINIGVAAFFYLYSLRNMRGDKYYSIHFDLQIWLHLFTMNQFVWAYATEAPEGTWWDRNSLLVAMFVGFFSVSRYYDYRNAKYAREVERDIEEYRAELARKRAERKVNEE